MTQLKIPPKFLNVAKKLVEEDFFKSQQEIMNLALKRGLLEGIIINEINRIEREMKQEGKTLKNFKENYGMDLNEFKKKVKEGKLLAVEHHEDLIEWEFVAKNMKQLKKKQKKLSEFYSSLVGA